MSIYSSESTVLHQFGRMAGQVEGFEPTDSSSYRTSDEEISLSSRSMTSSMTHAYSFASLKQLFKIKHKRKNTSGRNKIEFSDQEESDISSVMSLTANFGKQDRKKETQEIKNSTKKSVPEEHEMVGDLFVKNFRKALLSQKQVEDDESQSSSLFQKCIIRDVEPTQFKDIIGCSSAKIQLRRDFLNHAEDAEWESCCSSICLYGPPGTGKTSMFRAVMSHLGCRFTYCFISAATINDKYIGSSEKKLQSIFEEAEASAPCIIFVDEVDAIMRSREAGKSGNTGLHSVKTTLLENLSGIKGKSNGVILISATNYPWQLDAAFIRRTEMIYVGLPERPAERIMILQRYLKGNSLLSKSDWKQLGEMTTKFSATDLKSLSIRTWSLVKDEMKNSKYFTKICEEEDGIKVFTNCKSKKKATLIVPYKMLVRGKNVSIIPRSIEFKDFVEAMDHCRPSATPGLMQKYRLYQRCGRIDEN